MSLSGNDSDLMELYKQFELFVDDENVELPPVIKDDPPKIPKECKLYCKCTKPMLVKSEADRVPFLYCRKCKKEKVDE